jgi:hypothetical protein
MPSRRLIFPARRVVDQRTRPRTPDEPSAGPALVYHPGEAAENGLGSVIAILTALQDCFLGLPPRRARKPKLEPHGVPQVEPVDRPKGKLVCAPKPIVTNNSGAQAVALEPVVATIDRVESVPKEGRNDLRPRRPVTNTTTSARAHNGEVVVD